MADINTWMCRSNTICCSPYIETKHDKLDFPCSVIQWPSSSRKVHVHLLVLGTIMFLITALYAEKLGIESQKTWKPFMICYNTGLITAVIMLVVRGILQVLN